MDKVIPQIGASLQRNDAFSKVTGSEKFAADYYKDNLLWAGAKRAGIPHGIIRHIDISQAQNMPGVYAVLTRKDVPGTNRQGSVYKDQPVLAGTKVRHCGDPVALVLCESRDILEKALLKIRAEIAPLPGIFDTDSALQKDAPLVHEDNENGNILRNASFQKEKGIAGISECDVVAEGIFHTPVQEHAFLETQNGTAWKEPDGTIVIVTGTQSPYDDRLEVAYALGMEPAQIRVISPYMGGGFGGKEGSTVQCLLALAAIHSNGRPVKMWWSREESFAAGFKRHSARLHYRMGAMKNGRLHALHCRIYYDTGAYASFGEDVMAVGMEHAGGLYNIPNTSVEGWSIYTNNPVAGAMRGFGVIQVNFAVERMMDILSSKLGMDPLTFRLKNVVKRGDTNSAGIMLTHSAGAEHCFEQLACHPLWKNSEEWKSQAGLFKIRGAGIAGVWHSVGYGKGLPDACFAKVEISETGHIRVYNSISDMGQGNSSTLVQIAGEILCQKFFSIETVQPDTDQKLPSGSASANRSTFVGGNALIKACKELKQRLIHRSAIILALDSADNLELMPGRILHLPTGKSVLLEEIARTMPYEERAVIHCHMAPATDQNINTGKDKLPGIPHIVFCYGAHLAYVEIDRLTGCVEIKKYLIITDAGRVINPQIYEQQIQGAAAQGMGYALTEQAILDKGKILNPDFSNYLIPCALDIPDMDILAVETFEQTGPYGMKGIGQIATDGPLPAIANAVAEACGCDICHAPVTSEYVLNMLEQDK